MIVPDLNLLVYAYNADARHHAASKHWWEDSMNGSVPVGIPILVVSGFIRLMTQPRLLERPMTTDAALDAVESWFSFPHVNQINPGSRHFEILRGLLSDSGVGANLVTDAHIAAIAVEHHAEVFSNDSDFGRFSGLKWTNPI